MNLDDQEEDESLFSRCPELDLELKKLTQSLRGPIMMTQTQVLEWLTRRAGEIREIHTLMHYKCPAAK